MDNRNVNSIETDCTSFTCAACFLSLPNTEELSKHVCFDGKSIYSNEGIVYCLDDDDIDSTEETFNEFDSSISILDDHDDTNIDREPYIPQLKHTTSPKKPKKDVAMWTGSSTLALLTCYEAKKEDLDHPVKRGKVWASIANDLSELGYKFSGEQVRWKFNTLTRKYKDCVDNSKRTGTGAMTFKFFDHMENILGDRRTVQGQSTISSTFAKKNSKSKSSTMLSISSPGTSSTVSSNSAKKRIYMAQSDTSIPSPNPSSTVSSNSAKKRIYMAQSDTSIPSPNPSSTVSSNSAKKRIYMAQSDTSIPSPNPSSTVSSNSAKKRIYESPSKSEAGSSKNKQALEKVASSNTETTVCPTSVSNTQKSKRPQHGSGSRTAASKMELEKQCLQHLKNVADKDEMRKEKQEAYEKRKAEEVQMNKKLIALKERQLDIKQKTAKRKQEEAAEWHRDKLNIEKQKCQLLRELLETRTSSRSKRLKTDTDSSYED